MNFKLYNIVRYQETNSDTMIPQLFIFFFLWEISLRDWILRMGTLIRSDSLNPFGGRVIQHIQREGLAQP